MNIARERRAAAVCKELAAVERQEKRLKTSALKSKKASWRSELEGRIPDKVYSGLEGAFCKGFSIVFSRGTAIIEKSYKKDDIRANHAVRDYAVQLKGGRRELRQLSSGARQADLLNLAATTVEGVGLGALGIGLPDIVLFLGMLLKGVYETALNYGFDYDTPWEQTLILKMMSASLSSGDVWVKTNSEVDAMLTAEPVEISEDELKDQMSATASVFAVDMLLVKFIQGLPLVGILGGAANPVYYSKVMKYVQLKYRKRYLLKQKEI